MQLYAVTSFHGSLTMNSTVNDKNVSFSSFSSGFRKILSGSDAELPRQAQNDSVEQFRHYI